MHIRISIGTKLKPTILFFWTKFFQKGYFWSKTQKVNIITEFCIFELIWVPNFRIFWAKFSQKGHFRSKTENSHLCVCPCSFLTILNFFTREQTDTVVFVTWQDKSA